MLRDLRPGGAAALLLATVLLLAPSAQANDAVALGGMSWFNDGEYYYLGALIPVHGNFSQDDTVLKLWAYATDFEYDAGFDDVRVDGYGGEVSVGYQKMFQKGRLAGFVGLTHQDLDLSPDDPDADDLRKHTGVKLQLEGTHEFNEQVGVDGIASYTFVLNEYWGRFRPYLQFGSLNVGPEVILNGGDEYDHQSIGAFVNGIPLGFEGVGLDLSGGVMFRDGDGRSGYGGVSFSYAF